MKIQFGYLWKEIEFGIGFSWDNDSPFICLVFGYWFMQIKFGGKK